MSLLEVDKLTVRYAGLDAPVVQNLNLVIERGDSLGLVGESGAGKSQTALSLMGLLPTNANVKGSIRFDGTELVGANDHLLNQFRARRIAMVFQDPSEALNPYLRIGNQLSRVLLEHKFCAVAEAKERTLEMLNKVGLPDPDRQYRAYPHQLSGGMRQRALIGAALLGKPELLVADEPTTALDVTVQAQILRLLQQLRLESKTALLLITHDLGVVAGNCEHTLIMDRGKRIEEGLTREVFAAPKSDRTKALLSVASRVDRDFDYAPYSGDAGSLLEVEQLAVSYRGNRTGKKQRLNAVLEMTFSIADAETLAVVGESGSGKTSLARAILGLVPADRGRVCFLGSPLSEQVVGRDRESRRCLQLVFQNPLGSLNPTMAIGDIVAEPLRVHDIESDESAIQRKALQTLCKVGIDSALHSRYPHELSGGQAQRVAIARSLILQPRILVCDEAVAALDGTVRVGILDVLRKEQQRSGLSIIFITHDLGVVQQISHRVLVMYLGRLCEVSPTAFMFQRPRHPYTKALLSSIPVPDPDAQSVDVPITGEVSSALSPPNGCPFHPRCQHAIAICSEKMPELTDCEGSTVACHRAAELDLGY